MNNASLPYDKLQQYSMISDVHDVVRVRVKKVGDKETEYKKFSVDPSITTFDSLKLLLTKAFSIEGAFVVSYLLNDTRGRNGHFLTMSSDFDMDAAMQLAANSPDKCLRLKVDLNPSEKRLEDWVSVDAAELALLNREAQPSDHEVPRLGTGFIGGLFGGGQSSAEPTAAMAKSDGLNDAEFRQFQCASGRLIEVQQFRKFVYQHGVDPSLRKVVWRHLLNVFPQNMTGANRYELLKRQSREYYRLREDWMKLFKTNQLSERVLRLMNLIRKDVIRTDRTHPFYKGNDNVVALHNILTTYTLTHPSVGYCQGMSDLASPILLVQREEASAYICFCALMDRLRGHFAGNGTQMTRMFNHLALVLRHYDPELYDYMHEQQADDLFFCYRWLLLELKREFPLDDSLRLLEVLWSTLPIPEDNSERPMSEPAYSPKSLHCSSTDESRSPVGGSSPLFSSLLNRRLDDSVGPQASAVPSSSSSSVLVKNTGVVGSEQRPAPDDQMKLSESATTEVGSFSSLKNLLSHFSGKRPVRQPRHTRTVSLDGGSTVSLDGGAVSSSPSGQGLHPVDSSDTLVAGEFVERQMSTSGKTEPTAELDSSTLAEFGSPLTNDGKDWPVKRLTDETVGQEPVNRLDDGTAVGSSCCDDHDSGRCSDFSLVDSVVGGPKRRCQSCSGGVCRAGYGNAAGGAAGDGDSDRADRSVDCSVAVVTDEFDSSFGNISTPGCMSVDGNDVVPVAFSHQHLLSSSDDYADGGRSEKIGSKYSSAGSRHGGNGNGDERSDVTVEEGTEALSLLEGEQLPPPYQLGCGNPFLMFLCLTLLEQHRALILTKKMDYNEIAMHFDRLVRRHQVGRVLTDARLLYSDYLRSQRALHADHGVP